MAEEEVGLRLALKNRHEVVDGLDDVGDKLDRAGDEADRLNRKSRVAAGGMLSLGKGGRLAGRAIVYGMGGAVTAVIGAGIVLGKFSKDSIGEAREAQKVSAISRAEIKATGGVANVTARSISRLSGAISEKVGIDDEAIQSGGNLLLTFKNLRNEQGKGNKIFNQATRAAVNLSAAGFGSIESGSKMLGKALNDPLKGITALSRAGVTFSEEQVKRIEGFVEENDLLDAQKLILGEVKTQVGGVAAAQATWGDKAGVLWGNIQERFGTAIIPLLDRAQRWFVQDGGPELDRWIGMFEDRGIPALERGVRFIENKALPAIGDFVTDARPLAESIIPAIGSGLGAAADAFKIIAPLAKDVFDGFNDLPDWAQSAIAITAGAGLVGKKAGLFDKSSVLGSIATTAKPLPVYVVNNGIGKNGLPVPTGKPGGVPIPPFVPPLSGLPGWASKFGGLGLGALFTGVTLADRHPDGGWGTPAPDKVQDEKAFWAAVREEHDQTVGALDTLLVGPLGKTKQLRYDWSFITDNPADPRINEKGMTGAVTTAGGLMGLLGQMDHTEARPRVSVEGVGAALSAIGSVSDALLNVTSFFGGSTSGAPSSHDWSNLAPTKRHRPNLNGPRHPRHDPESPVSAGKSGSFDDYFADTPPAPRQPLHVHVDLRGREIGSAVIDDLDDQLARR